MKDCGKGIEPEKLERFLETGTGAGIGLSGMRARVRDLGGEFSLESDTTGTRIKVKLPFVGIRSLAAHQRGSPSL